MLQGDIKKTVLQIRSDIKNFNLLQTEHFPLIPDDSGITKRSQSKSILTKKQNKVTA